MLHNSTIVLPKFWIGQQVIYSSSETKKSGTQYEINPALCLFCLIFSCLQSESGSELYTGKAWRPHSSYPTISPVTTPGGWCQRVWRELYLFSQLPGMWTVWQRWKAPAVRTLAAGRRLHGSVQNAFINHVINLNGWCHLSREKIKIKYHHEPLCRLLLNENHRFQRISPLGQFFL